MAVILTIIKIPVRLQNSYETNNTTLINNNQDLNSLTKGNMLTALLLIWNTR